MNENLNEEILVARGVQKIYQQGSGRLHILKGLDLSIKVGEALCIVGSSGAGKSTLLHILGTLDNPSEGTVHFRNRNLFEMGDEELARFRNRSLGFVFQFHHLLAEFTALENVLLPARIGEKSLSESKSKAESLLVKVGLAERLHHYPSQLSGGELQRVAIARALVNDPEILFADEPTGNLDSQNGAKIQELFFDLIRSMNVTVIVVTHDTRFAQKFSRVLRMQDGYWVSGDKQTLLNGLS
jgi:lipoprotein-releasing system ATP-binding protein